MFKILKSGCFLHDFSMSPWGQKSPVSFKKRYCKIIHHKQGLKLLLKNQRFSGHLGLRSGLCPPAACVLWRVSLSVVWPGEDVSAVPLHHHWEPAVLEGRHHLCPLPDLLSCLFLIWCSVVIWNQFLLSNLTIACCFKPQQPTVTFYLLWLECKYITFTFVAFNVF